MLQVACQKSAICHLSFVICHSKGMKALIFDCDGVLADTELHGHLVAFNRMWQNAGVPWRWSEQQYAEKLKIGGGKERMRALFSEPAFQAAYPVPPDESVRKELLTHWHAQKTAIYQKIVASGNVPGRVGIKRLAEEALAAGWRLAVASTSAQPSVEAVLRFAVGETTAAQFKVFAGDIVPKKKPAPDIYLLASQELGVPSDCCLAVEDSRNGLLAATAAGIKTIVTTSYFTTAENFDEAALVLDSLGDPAGEACTVLANRTGHEIGPYLKASDLEAILSYRF
jgi:beta-phosphoglucomutase-like phosphatase (HAD superfamily)